MSEILINQLFAGSYLQEGSNIGHEVINLIKDDNGDNYLFVTPSGKIGKHNVDKILFVQNIQARKTMEVVMKAEGLSAATDNEVKNIFYSGVHISEIFNKNFHKGRNDADCISTMATFKADCIRFPKRGKRIIITVDPDYKSDDKGVYIFYLGGNKDRIVGQGMRTYLSSKSYTDVYKIVNNIFNDKQIWELRDTTQKMTDVSAHNNVGNSFLNIIRKENDELIMSNLLSYYFGFDHMLFTKFAKEVLGLRNFSNSFEIKREFNYMDLWIESDNSVIVIENKVKSKLNGKTSDGRSQLNKYYELTEKYIKKQNIGKAHYYLFLPNYNDFSNLVSDIHDKFRIVLYSEIYDFFMKYAADYINDKYFPDFLEGLRNQTMTYPELRYSIMRNRFLEKINQR